MTETNNLRENHRRMWPEPPRRFDANHQTGSGAPRTDSNDARQLPAEVIAHIVIALSRYLNQLRAESRRVPAQLEDLSIFLAGHVRLCHDVPLLDRWPVQADPPVVPSRLLLTKSEAAERLGVSCAPSSA